MRARLEWVHRKGQQVIVERNPTYMGETFAKFLLLAGLLYIPVHIRHWGDWIPFFGASLYLFWELVRVTDALGELANLWNEQCQAQQKAERDEYYRKRRQQREEP